MIKLIALDLDGTIVNEKLEISEPTVRLLGQVIRETDVRVVIATGRMFLSALPFARTLGIREPLITYQGAMIRDIDDGLTLLNHTPIPMALAREVLTLLAEHEFHTNLYINDSLFVTHHNTYATTYSRLAGVVPVFSDNLLESLTAAPTKIMAIDDHRVEDLLVLLQERFPDRLSYCKSRPNFCEIIDASASKWNAIKVLADRWGIRDEEIMAIGDQGNDLSMIEHAGVGVAMGNAPPEIQEFANYVTDTIERDGAARAIEKFVFGDMPLASPNGHGAQDGADPDTVRIHPRVSG